MPDIIVDFVRHAGLISPLTFLIVVICVLIGLGNDDSTVGNGRSTID
jgi:hypothetical protein